MLRTGLATALVGRPNVGLSSLLLQLLHETKAIDTDVADSTRDVLTTYVNVRGVPLLLVHTAGIHDTTDKVTKIGDTRSRQALTQADHILLVLDQSEPHTTTHKQLLAATAHKLRILVLLKQDLPARLDTAALLQLVHADTILKTALPTRHGLDALEQHFAKLFFGGLTNSQDSVLVSNARQIGLLRQASKSLDAVLAGITAGMPIHLVQIHNTADWDKLGTITGTSAPDTLITQLFSQFCLGK